MTLVRRMADHLLEEHPRRAVSVLERLGVEDALAVVESTSVDRAAGIVPCLSPAYAEEVLDQLPPKRIASILASLNADEAARLLRRVDEERAEAILGALPAKLQRSLRALLHFPPNTAGGLMDPDVLALPMDLSVRDALQRIREDAESARYNLYVLEGAKLVGALNLRELLLASPDESLADVMIRDPHRVLATADRASVLTHPGWRQVHSLPVVDESGSYLGAIRYRALRDLEDELLGTRVDDVDSSAAFGEVISAGARGLLDALGGARPPRGKGMG